MGFVIATYFATACSIICCKVGKVVPINFVLLAVFTFCVSWLVGITCMRTDPKTVLMAAVLTMAMFLGLTLYACTTKTDFTTSLCGFHMLVIHLTLIVFMIPMCFIMQSRMLHLVFAYIGVAIFSFYIIYDTQMIMNGDRTNGEFDEDDYILAAVILYMDIINLFLYVLKILRGGSN